MKKDIFNGKIKKEYFSYVLGCMIFLVLLQVGVGVLCIYASIHGMVTNTLGERIFIASFGVIAFILAGAYVFFEFLVIRGFPKYERIRRVLFNSDVYFTDSTSNEYFGNSRTVRGRRSKAAFEIVTAFADAEKGMGEKKPLRYRIYITLAAVIALVELVFLIAMPLLYGDGIVFPNMPNNAFVLMLLLVGFVCIALAVFFLVRALNAALTAPLEKDKWSGELYTALAELSVRENRKKLKFLYNKNQLEEIESLVKSASPNAELRLEIKGNRAVSFTVVDTSSNRVRFRGSFI